MKAHEKRLRLLMRQTDGRFERLMVLRADLSRLLDEKAEADARTEQKDHALSEARSALFQALRHAQTEVMAEHIKAAIANSTAALKPRRNPSTASKRSHVCVTHSGDEQVTCDDPACPHKRRR